MTRLIATCPQDIRPPVFIDQLAAAFLRRKRQQQIVQLESGRDLQKASRPLAAARCGELAVRAGGVIGTADKARCIRSATMKCLLARSSATIASAVERSISRSPWRRRGSKTQEDRYAP